MDYCNKFSFDVLSEDVLKFKRSRWQDRYRCEITQKNMSVVFTVLIICEPNQDICRLKVVVFRQLDFLYWTEV